MARPAVTHSPLSARQVVRLALGVILAVACADYITAPTGSTTTGRIARGVKLSTTSLSLQIGDTARVSATVLDQQGQPFATIPDGVQLSWSTTDVTRATVDPAGLVTALRSGQVSVAAAIQTDLGRVSVKAPVSIRGHPAALKLVKGSGQSGVVGTALSGSVTVQVNDVNGDPVPGISVQFQGAAADGAAPPQTVVSDSLGSAVAVWTLGHRAGVQSLTVVASDGSASASLSVNATAVAGPPAFAHVTPGRLGFATLGRTATLAYTVQDQYGNATSPVSGLQWVSVAPLVATVDAAGTVKAVANGTAYVTVRGGGLPAADSDTVVVRQVVAAIAVTSSAPTVAAGQTITLAVTANDSAGSPAPGVAVTWTVAPAVAGTVDAQSVFHAVQTGNATLIASTPTGFTGSTSVTVTPGAPVHIVGMSGDNQTGAAGAALSQPIVVRITDQFGNAVPGAGATFTPVQPNGGSVSATVATTAANGTASVIWTMPNTPGAHATLHATLGSELVTFQATVSGGGPPLGGSRTWTGATSTDWNTASNWSPASVPQSTDAVVIGAGAPNAPTLTGVATIASLTINIGGNLTLAFRSRMFVAGDVSVNPNQVIGGLGELVLAGFNAHLSGTGGPDSTIVTGNVTATGSVSATYLSLQHGTLTLGGQTVTAYSLDADSASSLVMTNARDSLNLRTATFNGAAESGRLTAGVIVASSSVLGVYGVNDSTAGRQFVAAPAHRIVLTGNGIIGNTNSCDCQFPSMTFGSVLIRGFRPVNTSVSGIVFTSGSMTIALQSTLAVNRGNTLVVHGDFVLTDGGMLTGYGVEVAGDLREGGGSNITLQDLQLGGPGGTQYVQGILQVNDQIVFAGTHQPIYPGFAGSISYYSIVVQGSAYLTGPASIYGFLEVDGSFDLAGNSLQVRLQFIQTGNLIMTSDADTLRIGGNVGWYGAPGSQLTGGRIIVGGNVIPTKVFFGSSPGAPANYVASGTHTFEMIPQVGWTGYPGTDSIWATPGDNVSAFQNFKLDSNEIAWISDPTMPVLGTFELDHDAGADLSVNTRMNVQSLVLSDGSILNIHGELAVCDAPNISPNAFIFGNLPIPTCNRIGRLGLPPATVSTQREPKVPVVNVRDIERQRRAGGRPPAPRD